MGIYEGNIRWLEQNLNNEEFKKSLMHSCHRVSGDSTPETEEVIKKLRDYQLGVFNMLEKGSVPYAEIRVKIMNHLIDFEGLDEINGYLSVISKFFLIKR